MAALLNGPGLPLLLTIPISYLLDAIKGRVGLSTSLLDVSHVVAGLDFPAALFRLLTAVVQDYWLMVVAAGISRGRRARAVHRALAIEPRKAAATSRAELECCARDLLSLGDSTSGRPRSGRRSEVLHRRRDVLHQRLLGFGTAALDDVDEDHGHYFLASAA